MKLKIQSISAAKMMQRCRSFLLVTPLLCLLLPSCALLSDGSAKQSAPRKELNEKERMQFARLFLDGNKAKILGDYSEARKLFVKALDIDPGSGATHFELAKLSAEQGDFEEAIKRTEIARASDLDNVWYAHFLAQLYAEVGKLEESVELYREITRQRPEELENYFNLANLLSASGKYKEALEIFEDIEDRLGPNEELSMQKQLIYLEQKDFKRALKEVEALIDADPSEVRYYGMKAEIYQQMGKDEEALELYELMHRENPGNGLVLLALYEIHRDKGNRDKADDYLKQAFESKELNVDVKVNILLNYLNVKTLKNRRDFIISLGNALEKAHPEEAKSYAIQGDIYYNLNELEKSREKFREAINLDPNRPPIWQQILTLDSQLNDFDAMLSESEQATEYFPVQAIFYLFNGVAHMQKGNLDEAIEALEAGLGLVVDNDALAGQFYASLGDAYHEADRHEESDAAYENALEIDPSNPLVLNNYAYYLSLRSKNLEKAEKMAKKANDLAPNEASFQDTYAWVLYKRGNYRNARFWLEEALKNGGDQDPTVLEHYGDVLHALGQHPDAVRAWQQAIDAGGDEEALLEKIHDESIGQ